MTRSRRSGWMTPAHGSRCRLALLPSKATWRWFASTSDTRWPVQEYRDLWILRFAADGRVADFEEWAYWPGKPSSALDEPT